LFLVFGVRWPLSEMNVTWIERCLPLQPIAEEKPTLRLSPAISFRATRLLIAASMNCTTVSSPAGWSRDWGTVNCSSSRP
jgi:hypothetical protein